MDSRIALLETRKKKLKPEWLAERALCLQCTEVSLEKVLLAISELKTHKARWEKPAAFVPQLKE